VLDLDAAARETVGQPLERGPAWAAAGTSG
jgi:hypothetical protein